jgi:hypothetical protein
MNRRRSQLDFADSCPPEAVLEAQSEPDESASEIQSEEAAEYIASLLGSLREIAVASHLRLLSDLLSVAEEEARLHSRA